MSNTLDISIGPVGKGSVVLNGQDLSDTVRGLTLTCGVGELTTVTLECVDLDVTVDLTVADDDGVVLRDVTPIGSDHRILEFHEVAPV